MGSILSLSNKHPISQWLYESLIYGHIVCAGQSGNAFVSIASGYLGQSFNIFIF
jgi:hypothetical protein